ncbi:lysophospholipid acyltransferase family protein [Abyssicoccus albus]|uniref:1-acyl-sn-glycerol-3-phosphate acyltransferase n=1 Tax=Abyssicoccus albus TaxID=1817405 RepID=A0A3N5C6R0_9BACL|nr:lysophospholipid acyltransferase family protein [Abyssicoccus albus]RPF58038.1 1-acyl-sn-glycerol-3-phosphate acyltransferase [Abyssicoccus albus]
MLYKIAKYLLILILFPIFKVKVIGKNRVPRSGGIVICSNHASALDPPLLGICVPRDVSFMAKKELFTHWLLGPLISRLNAFPIDRGKGDRNTIRQISSVLEEGNALGIFPEGQRSKDGRIQKGQNGAAFAALRSGAVIVPACIKGSYKPFTRHKVVFGAPISTVRLKDEGIKTKELTELIMSEIKKLHADTTI